jgi:hypothetical protein
MAGTVRVVRTALAWTSAKYMGLRLRRRPIYNKTRKKGLGNSVKVAQLDTGHEMAPFVHCKLTDGPGRIDGIPDYNNLTLARDFNARTAVAGT